MLQVPSLLQAVHVFAAPAVQSTVCELLPLHDPRQPTHRRPWSLVPAPHTVSQGVVSLHAVHVFETPAAHVSYFSSRLMPKTHKRPHKPHARVIRCWPYPHREEQLPAFAHAVHCTGREHANTLVHVLPVCDRNTQVSSRARSRHSIHELSKIRRATRAAAIVFVF